MGRDAHPWDSSGSDTPTPLPLLLSFPFLIDLAPPFGDSLSEFSSGLSTMASSTPSKKPLPVLDFSSFITFYFLTH